MRPSPMQTNFRFEPDGSGVRHNADWDIQALKEIRQISLSRNRDKHVLRSIHIEILN